MTLAIRNLFSLLYIWSLWKIAMKLKSVHEPISEATRTCTRNKVEQFIHLSEHTKKTDINKYV